MPKVSIIVPNYNYVRYLPKRIESIVQQTYTDYEIILLDDCSTDGSQTYLENVPNTHKLVTLSLIPKTQEVLLPNGKRASL